MSSSSFQELHRSLSASPDFRQIQDAWSEHEQLLGALKGLVPEPHLLQILRVRRSDPARGIRGSELTITAATAAAAVKIRLLLSGQEPRLAALGLGLQSFRVLAQRQQTILRPEKRVPKRSAIPEKTKEDLRRLAEGLSAGPLQAALHKIGRARKT